MSLSTLLETYSLSEILELNDLTEEDVLEYLVEQRIIKLPNVKPLEFDNAGYRD